MTRKTGTSRRALLLAALLSMGSHWLVLRGIDLDFDAPGPDSTQPQTVMLTAVTLPVAPKIASAPAGQKSVTQSSTGAIATPPETAADPKATEDAPHTPPNADADAPKSPGTDVPAQHVAPQSGQLQFQVYLGDGEGEPLAAMTHTLTFTDGHYELGSRGEALGFMALLYSGLLTQSSTGVWDSGGFSTRTYTEQRGKKPEARAQVDVDKREVVFSNGAHMLLTDLHVNDRLSAMYQLGLKLQANGNLLNVPAMDVLSANSLEKWQFVRVGIETIRQGDTTVQAVHFRRQSPEGQEKTAIDIWYDPVTDPWPLQIRLTDKKGMVITQRRAGLAVAGKKGSHQSGH